MRLSTVGKMVIPVVCLLVVSRGLLATGADAAERAGPIRIGALTESWGPTPQVVGLRDGLLALGYREPEQFVIGVRFTQGDPAALPTAVQELMQRGADIIFATDASAAKAAQLATHRIPIVFAGVGAPLELGLVQGFARAGLYAPEHDGGEHSPEPVPREATGPPGILWRGFRSGVSVEPLGQEGRLRAIPGPQRPDPRDQRQPSLLTADVCRFTQTAVPAPQRLSRADGDPAVRPAVAQPDVCPTRVLPHRSAGDHPLPVAHRGRRNHRLCERTTARGRTGARGEALGWHGDRGP
jgi:hypothetical protein